MIGGIPQVMIPYYGIGSARKRLETDESGVPVWNPMREEFQIRDGLVAGDDRLPPATAGSGVSGTLYVSMQQLYKGDTLTQLGFFTATAGVTSPTHGWMVVLDPNRIKVAETADSLTTAIAAQTAFYWNLLTPYVVPASGIYAFGFCFVCTGTYTVLSASSATGRGGAMGSGNTPIIAATSDTGLTGGVPALNPAAAYTPINNKFLIVAK